MENLNQSFSQYAGCPVRNVLDHFGDKWSMLVLFQLHKGNTVRFNEFMKEMTDISQKMLTSTLRRLEDMMLVTRTVYPEVPSRVEYQLTELGQSLMPHIINLASWAKEHMPEIKGEKQE